MNFLPAVLIILCACLAVYEIVTLILRIRKKAKLKKKVKDNLEERNQSDEED